MPSRLKQRLIAEFIGTAVLTAVVVGSGILASRLTHDTSLIVLLGTVATVPALGVLIWVLGPISGAHFNPAVSLVMRLRGAVNNSTMVAYIAVQCAGAVLGAVIANLMYELPALSISHTARGGMGRFLGEVVATAGLLAIVCIVIDRGLSRLIPVAVPAWIASASLFTSSTAFANPAVTLGRVFSDSSPGIAPNSAVAFAGAQFLGAFIGLLISRAGSTSAIGEPDVIRQR